MRTRKRCCWHQINKMLKRFECKPITAKKYKKNGTARDRYVKLCVFTFLTWLNCTKQRMYHFECWTLIRIGYVVVDFGHFHNKSGWQWYTIDSPIFGEWYSLVELVKYQCPFVSFSRLNILIVVQIEWK